MKVRKIVAGLAAVSMLLTHHNRDHELLSNRLPDCLVLLLVVFHPLLVCDMAYKGIVVEKVEAYQ